LGRIHQFYEQKRQRLTKKPPQFGSGMNVYEWHAHWHEQKFQVNRREHHKFLSFSKFICESQSGYLLSMGLLYALYFFNSSAEYIYVNIQTPGVTFAIAGSRNKGPF